MPRKPGTTPRYAKSQTELCSYLTPPRDRKAIQEGLKLPGNPGRSKDGRYEIAEWQEFIARNLPAAGGSYGPSSDDKRNLEMEKLRLQNDKLKFELEVKRKDFTANTDVEQSVGKMVMTAKRALMSLPAMLAPVVVGMTEVEAEKRIREELVRALTHLSHDPTGESAPIAPAPTPGQP